MSGEMNNSFFMQLNEGFFTQQGMHFSPLTLKRHAAIPFKEQQQFPILVDILSRKNFHHACLLVDFAPRLYSYFIEAFLLYLTHDNTPQHLHASELIFIDSRQLSIHKNQFKSIEKDFTALLETLNHADKYLLFAITDDSLLNHKHQDMESPEGFLAAQLTPLLEHPKCRILLFLNAKKHQTNLLNEDERFIYINIHVPTKDDIVMILKQQRAELENFHRVIIPEELLTYAYSLAEHFLSTTKTLEKAIQLLDSSSARARAMAGVDESAPHHPVVTISVLSSILSSWTKIPATHLLTHKFKLHEFTQALLNKIVGQDAAIQLLGHYLQQARTHSDKTTKPACAFLFAGSAHAGKHSTALALAEVVYKQTHILYCNQTTPQNLVSILDIKVKCQQDPHYLTLKEVITHTPHALILLENINQFSTRILDGLQEILSTGYLQENGMQYNFRHAMLMLTTKLGSQRLLEINSGYFADAREEEDQNSDLLQLVMREQKRETHATSLYSPQELIKEILPEIQAVLPQALTQHLQIIPFLPLNQSAYEKIVKLKLSEWTHMLVTKHGIEFSYAPEIINYLVNEILQTRELEQHHVNIDTVLQPVFLIIEQALLNHVDNNSRSKQLFLQLNETGQILRCDWLVSATTTGEHAL